MRAAYCGVDAIGAVQSEEAEVKEGNEHGELDVGASTTAATSGAELAEYFGSRCQRACGCSLAR